MENVCVMCGCTYPTTLMHYVGIIELLGSDVFEFVVIFGVDEVLEELERIFFWTLRP